MLPCPPRRRALVALALIAACGHAPTPRRPAPRPAVVQLSAIRTTPLPERAAARVSAGTHAPARSAGTADAVAHVLRVGRPGFVRCFRAARQSDPALTGARLALHVTIDARGAVAAAAPARGDRALGDCIARGLRQLRLPRALAPAVIDVPIVLAAPTAG
ncbi:MAG: hypothetical protein IPH44_09955 [Myxococcales bacterium]|jgi:hypothetical protein|nr:hypothetical protein [Myxococcales bacterium]MBK7198870.1 hypothetical protein [Myxococcales bacterium]MBP6845714.1 hypothetical protein [Kofleriaceae bacterium]